ncbi:MAG: hypothetical protein J5634_00420 [Bacilli bacterium]|nr:hypothetical protein [Bacilli bacterium]
MEIINNNEVIINKSLYSDIKKFYSDIFSKPRIYDKDNVVVSDSEIKELIHSIKNDLTINEINFAKKICDNVDKTSFLKALDLYEEDLSKVSRNSFTHRNDHHLYDNLIISGLKLKEEKEKIESAPSLIKKISRMLSNIEESKLVDDVLDLNDEFKELKKSKATFEKYHEFFIKLSNIICESYNENLTDVSLISSSTNLNLIVSEIENQAYLLTEKNIKRASYGVILKANDNIKSASNKENDDNLLPFDKLDKKDNFIEVYDSKPIACFAITLGEKTLSKNYVNAERISQKYHNLPLIEIDISKYISIGDSKEYFNRFVDQLFEDKNVDIGKKDDELYSKFDNFYREFKFLKTKKYNESNIRNLFDFNVRLITSQEVCNLDNLLNNYSISEIETVLKHNDNLFDDNIFRHKTITKAGLERFIYKFYNYRLNETLNKIYPGFSTVLTYLKNLDDEELKQFVLDVNNGKVVDSWLMAQTIDPIHTSVIVVANEKELSILKKYKSENLDKIQNEIKELLSLKEYLSSKDDEKIKKLVNAMQR